MSVFQKERSVDTPSRSWLRLKQVIEWSGLSTNAFAHAIGLKRAENLYQIKKGNYSISKELADKITIKYSNINKAWLLTGDGNMMADEESDSQQIPYYDTGIQQIDLNDNVRPTHYLKIPLLTNCDLAVMHTGDSMKPDIPSGSIVILKEIDKHAVLSGDIYLVMTDDYNIIRSVRISESKDGALRLIPKNRDEFDEIIMEKEKVRRLFLVKGVISMRAT